LQGNVEVHKGEKPMCPACIATAALIFGGAISTGGLTALFAKKFHGDEAAAKTAEQSTAKENKDGKHQD